MRLGLLVVSPFLFFAFGCQNTASSQSGLVSPARIIIGFEETVNPPGNELLSRLGRALGCELQPLHAVGGNAYVYSCLTGDTEESLTRKLDGLGRHKGVHYAEIDRKRGIRN